MKKFILIILLILPLCSTGEYEKVKLPKLFPNAQMEMGACYHDVNKDGYMDIVLIYAGGEIIKALMPHEFIDAMEHEDDK